jgi:hypothetical protein
MPLLEPVIKQFSRCSTSYQRSPERKVSVYAQTATSVRRTAPMTIHDGDSSFPVRDVAGAAAAIADGRPICGKHGWLTSRLSPRKRTHANEIGSWAHDLSPRTRHPPCDHASRIVKVRRLCDMTNVLVDAIHQERPRASELLQRAGKASAATQGRRYSPLLPAATGSDMR